MKSRKAKPGERVMKQVIKTVTNTVMPSNVITLLLKSFLICATILSICIESVKYG